ncbi:hypothetical protein GH733_014431, partial [Mirounga leonina]
MRLSSGFKGSHCEKDIDECTGGVVECHNHSSWVNLPGDECALRTHTFGVILPPSACQGDSTASVFLGPPALVTAHMENCSVIGRTKRFSANRQLVIAGIQMLTFSVAQSVNQGHKSIFRSKWTQALSKWRQLDSQLPAVPVSGRKGRLLVTCSSLSCEYTAILERHYCSHCLITLPRTSENLAWTAVAFQGLAAQYEHGWISLYNPQMQGWKRLLFCGFR